MMFILSIFLIISQAFALRDGDPCNANGQAGVCRLIYRCPYALNLVNIHEKKPVHCAWVSAKSRDEIVCCPLNTSGHTNGDLRNVFGATSDGVIRSKSGQMSCKSTGKLPVICCNKNPDPPPPPEPKTCPPMPEPFSTELRNDLIWRKCVEYQRYLYPCLSDERNPGRYIRELNCSASTLRDRVSGATPAVPLEFPHMALLGCKNIEMHRTEWIGGGSLISDIFILTAAHVVHHDDFGPVRYALLGTITKKTRDGLLYNIVAHYQEPGYKKSDKYHDIALVKLDRKVTFSQSIRPACLPMSNVEVFPLRIVSGWGQTGPDEKPSDKLLKAFINELSPSICKEKLDTTRGWDSKTMICAGDNEGTNKDTCPGDSGGPYMSFLLNLNCTYIVEGVVAWGVNCGNKTPAAYTKVSAYIDWIVSIVWPRESQFQ